MRRIMKSGGVWPGIWVMGLLFIGVASGCRNERTADDDGDGGSTGATGGSGRNEAGGTDVNPTKPIGAVCGCNDECSTGFCNFVDADFALCTNPGARQLCSGSICFTGLSGRGVPCESGGSGGSSSGSGGSSGWSTGGSSGGSTGGIGGNLVTGGTGGSAGPTGGVAATGGATLGGTGGVVPTGGTAGPGGTGATGGSGPAGGSTSAGAGGVAITGTSGAAGSAGSTPGPGTAGGRGGAGGDPGIVSAGAGGDGGDAAGVSPVFLTTGVGALVVTGASFSSTFDSNTANPGYHFVVLALEFADQRDITISLMTSILDEMGNAEIHLADEEGTLWPFVMTVSNSSGSSTFRIASPVSTAAGTRLDLVWPPNDPTDLSPFLDAG